MIDDLDDMYDSLLKPANMTRRKQKPKYADLPSAASLGIKASGRATEFHGGAAELRRNGWQAVGMKASGKTISGGDRKNAFKVIPAGPIPAEYEPRAEIPDYIKLSYTNYAGGLIKWRYTQQNRDGTISEWDEYADPHPVNLKRGHE